MNDSKSIAFILASIFSGSAIKLCGALIDRAKKDKKSFFVIPGGRLNAEANSEYLRNSIYELVNTENFDSLISWGSSIGGVVTSEELTNFHNHFEPIP